MSTFTTDNRSFALNTESGHKFLKPFTGQLNWVKIIKMSGWITIILGAITSLKKALSELRAPLVPRCLDKRDSTVFALNSYIGGQSSQLGLH